MCVCVCVCVCACRGFSTDPTFRFDAPESRKGCFGAGGLPGCLLNATTAAQAPTSTVVAANGGPTIAFRCHCRDGCHGPKRTGGGARSHSRRSVSYVVAGGNRRRGGGVNSAETIKGEGKEDIHPTHLLCLSEFRHPRRARSTTARRLERDDDDPPDFDDDE